MEDKFACDSQYTKLRWLKSLRRSVVDLAKALLHYVYVCICMFDSHFKTYE